MEIRTIAFTSRWTSPIFRCTMLLVNPDISRNCDLRIHPCPSVRIPVPKIQWFIHGIFLKFCRVSTVWERKCNLLRFLKIILFASLRTLLGLKTPQNDTFRLLTFYPSIVFFWDSIKMWRHFTNYKSLLWWTLGKFWFVSPGFLELRLTCLGAICEIRQNIDMTRFKLQHPSNGNCKSS